MSDERLVFNNSPKSKPIDTINYEIQMWRRSFAAIALKREVLAQTKGGDDLYEYNLRIEGFLLHTRNLLAFFTDRHNLDTDLRISQTEWTEGNVDAALVQTFKDRADAVDKAHHGDKEADTCYYEISRYLSHCTRLRHLNVKKWDIDAMFLELDPVLRDFEARFVSTQHRSPQLSIPTLGDAQHTTSFQRFQVLGSTSTED